MTLVQYWYLTLYVPVPYLHFSLYACFHMMTSSNGEIFRATSPLRGEFTDAFPAQRPVTLRIDISLDLRLNKRLSKQSWGWWFETTSRHQMEILSVSLGPLSPVNSRHKFQWRGALILSFICAFNKQLSKQPWGLLFETPSGSLWRYCNAKMHNSTLAISVISAIMCINSRHSFHNKLFNIWPWLPWRSVLYNTKKCTYMIHQ